MNRDSTDEWLPDTEPPKKASMVSMDRRPLLERTKMSNRGLVDFRRVCDQMGILNRAADTIQDAPSGSENVPTLTPVGREGTK
jgi:hypothetical protein